MPERPHIPRELERAVKVEAGHRCAIPTCRATSGLEIHHIVDYATVQEHVFENLILLCAICHTRATNREIDVKAMKAYKANLSLLAHRYGDLERRLLEYFVGNPDNTEIQLDTSHALLLHYLLVDGLVEYRGPGRGSTFALKPGMNEYMPGPAKWGLTDEGQEVVRHLRDARALE